MGYGARHSDKCSEKELKEFREKVDNFLTDELSVKLKTKSFNSFGGEVRIYTGKKVERMPLKIRKRLVAYKETNGEYVGAPEEIKILKFRGGSQLWEKHSDPIIEIEYFSVYRTDDWTDEKEELRRWIALKFEKKS